MNSRPSQFKKVIIWILALISLCIGLYLLYAQGRPAPIAMKREIFEGVTYHRHVRYAPHPMIAHVLVIDTRTKGIRFLVTPPEEDWKDSEFPLRARTTSQFLTDFGVQIAINGDRFHPWWSRSPLDYYPHEGDRVDTQGSAASKGEVYSKGLKLDEGAAPTLYINRRNSMGINQAPGRLYDAISGDRILLLQGKIVEGLESPELDPRTAIGLNRNGRWLILAVVDGRQPFYSEGATYTELAKLLLDYGAFTGMAFDGGGSSTMVVEGDDGRPEVLNSPIDLYIPGRERAVANHLGIYLNANP